MCIFIFKEMSKLQYNASLLTPKLLADNNRGYSDVTCFRCYGDEITPPSFIMMNTSMRPNDTQLQSTDDMYVSEDCQPYI